MERRGDKGSGKRQALVYDTLPQTSAIVDYAAIGLERNCQLTDSFSGDAQRAESL